MIGCCLCWMARKLHQVLVVVKLMLYEAKVYIEARMFTL